MRCYCQITVGLVSLDKYTHPSSDLFAFSKPSKEQVQKFDGQLNTTYSKERPVTRVRTSETRRLKQASLTDATQGRTPLGEWPTARRKSHCYHALTATTKPVMDLPNLTHWLLVLTVRFLPG